MPGFAPTTRIRTTLGDIPASLLRRGDEVITPSGVSCQIEWIDRVGLEGDFLASVPGARPVTIPAGSLDGHTPARDLIVSGRQRVLVDAEAREFADSRDLAVYPTPQQLSQTDLSSIEYTMFHCGRPVLVLAEGVWCAVDELSSTRGRRSA